MKNLLILLVLVCTTALGQTKKLYPYMENKKWGMINEDLVVILTPQLDAIFEISSDRSAIVKKDGKYGVITPTGKFAVQPIYESLERFEEGWGRGKVNGKDVIVNFTTGKPGGTYDNVERFCYCKSPLFVVKTGEKYAIANGVTGKPITKFIYDNIDFQNSMTGTRAYVTIAKKMGVFDHSTGKMILPIEFDEINSYTTLDADEEYYEVKKASGTERFSHTGKAIPVKPGETVEEMVFTEEVSTPDFSGDGGRRELFVYNAGGSNWKITFEKRGYGSTEILETFNISGYEKVEKIEGIWYDPQQRQYLKVTNAGKTGIIDHTGKVVVELIYDAIEPQAREFYAIKAGPLFGLLTKEFGVIKKPIFKSAPEWNHHYDEWLVTMPDDRAGYMNKAGKVFLPGFQD